MGTEAPISPGGFLEWSPFRTCTKLPTFGRLVVSNTAKTSTRLVISSFLSVTLLPLLWGCDSGAFPGHVTLTASLLRLSLA